MKPFDLKQVIKDRTDLEALVEWANKPNPPLPKKVEVVKVKGRAGFINFFREITREVRP